MRKAELDRRKARRYSLELNLRYTVCAGKAQLYSGTGVSINISSNGLLFRSSARLTAGEQVLVALEWPLQSPGGRPLLLLMSGRVAWSKASRIALSVSRYELVSSDVPAELAVLPAPARQVPPPSVRHPHQWGVQAPLILVVESHEVYALVAAMMGPQGYIVRRVPAETAFQVIENGAFSVRLLITDTLDPFASLDLPVPVVYTGPPPAPAAAPKLVILEKPLLYGALRSAVTRLCSREVELNGFGAVQ